MIYGYASIFCLFMVLIGYSIGRRVGIKEGEQQSLRKTIIDLKMDYYYQKECPICTAKYEKTKDKWRGASS